MPAYHSAFLQDTDVRIIGNFALLPLRTRTRGPAYTLPPLPPSITSDLDIDPDSEYYDVLDETMTLFRANTLFRNFEIKGPADRVLIYGILFVSDCLGRIKPNMSLRDSEKALQTAALDYFALPGDPAFPLNALYQPPRDRIEAEALRGYIGQMRQELAIRLLNRVYADGTGKPVVVEFHQEAIYGQELVGVAAGRWHGQWRDPPDGSNREKVQYITLVD